MKWSRNKKYADALSGQEQDNSKCEQAKFQQLKQAKLSRAAQTWRHSKIREGFRLAASKSKAYQNRAILLLEDGPLVDVPGCIHSLNNVGKLSINIGSTTHTLQSSASLLDLATCNQTVGRVRDDQTAQEEDQGRHNGQTNRHTPPMGVQVLSAVVDPLSNPDTNGGGHLEHDVEGTTGMGGGNL